jgi:hypothetical protein
LTASPGPSRRRFWLLLVVSVAAFILVGVAIVLELTRGPPEPTTAYSSTFMVGTKGGCGEIIGWSGYCDMVNLTLLGGHASERLVLLEVSFSGTCPYGCAAELGSYPRNSSSWQGLETAYGNGSAIAGGVVWGGPDFIQVWESTFCDNPAGCSHYAPVTVNIQVKDYGSVTA